MSNDVTADNIRTWREQGLTVAIHRACNHCGAPGKFLSVEFVRLEWPECYVPPEDERHDQPVGDRCPKCGKLRDPSLIERLGEVWRKRFT